MEYDALKLQNQLCFPLYASAREVVKLYKPYLDALGLTYTQYITMMVLWEHGKLNVKEIGEYLYLDSGTLTPLLKKLEGQGYIERKRSLEDERNVTVETTEKGMELRDSAIDIPQKIGACIDLSTEDAQTLYRILYQILDDTRK